MIDVHSLVAFVYQKPEYRSYKFTYCVSKFICINHLFRLLTLEILIIYATPIFI